MYRNFKVQAVTTDTVKNDGKGFQNTAIIDRNTIYPESLVENETTHNEAKNTKED